MGSTQPSPSQGYPPAINSPIPIYTPGWREALWELSVLLKNTTQCPRPGLEPGALASALTMRPPRLPHKACSTFAKSVAFVYIHRGDKKHIHWSVLNDNRIWKLFTSKFTVPSCVLLYGKFPGVKVVILLGLSTVDSRQLKPSGEIEKDSSFRKFMLSSVKLDKKKGLKGDESRIRHLWSLPSSKLERTNKRQVWYPVTKRWRMLFVKSRTARHQSTWTAVNTMAVNLRIMHAFSKLSLWSNSILPGEKYWVPLNVYLLLLRI